MQKQIDEFKLSPKNELILQDRMHQVDELERNIEETRQVFAKYIESGNEMCQNVNKLVKNFENLIGPDKSLSPVINILTKFATLMTDHYKLVQESIIDKIDMFTNSDIRQAEEDGKAANKEYSSYSKLLDSYVSVPTKKRSQNNEFHDLQAKLLAQNWMAIKSNFSFSRSLGLIERKRVLEMTSYFILFANRLGQSFEQCAQVYEKSKDSFNIIQQALPSTVDELSDYKTHTTRLELSLQKFFYLYFKSFNESTVYTSCNDLTYEGFLWLKKPKFKKWDKRYCILKYGLFSVFKNSTKPAKTYKLLCSTVKPIEDSERPSCFTLISTEYKFVFQALTSYDRDKWINIIQNNIEWLLTRSSPTKSSTTMNNDDDFANNLLLARNTSTIMNICSSMPTNAICADCGAKAPTWVCINWTTVICIQCSGVHRYLTTSVSKVRSTTLDDIDDTTIELFKIIGNLHANKILEENLGRSNEGENQAVTKIGPDASKESRCYFITQKYKNLAFVKKVSIDVENAIRSNDIISVYRSICTGQIRQVPFALHLAALSGFHLICRLIVLNMEDPNSAIDGWNALSYAAYYGRVKAAQTLLSSGCSPDSAKPEANPYRIAILKKDDEMAALFFPFWNKDLQVTGQLEDPPLKFESNPI